MESEYPQSNKNQNSSILKRVYSKECSHKWRVIKQERNKEVSRLLRPKERGVINQEVCEICGQMRIKLRKY